MAKEISKCKMGIVVVENEIDSCPRVIPELLSCGLPIVVLNDVRFWKEKYITSKTGKSTNKISFWTTVQQVLDNYKLYNPRKYYEENLSLNIAAKYLRKKIDEVSF